MDRGDINAARMLAHALKGSAGSVGAVKLQAAAAELENSLRESLADAELLACVEAEWQQAVESMAVLLQSPMNEPSA